MSHARFLNSLSTGLPVLLLAFFYAGVPCAQAAEGGSSNYAPGFYGDFGIAMAPEPALYLRSDFYGYSADAGGRRVVEHGEVRLDLEVDVAMAMLTAFNVTEHEILGGRYAFGAYIPVVYADLASTIVVNEESVSADADRAAFGDMGILPASLCWTFGNYSVNAYETVIMPTGSYDPNRDVDSGLNYWSFDTVVAGTYLHPEKGFELSAVLGYLYNTENEDTNYQTGQELHLDYMVNQFFSETFALGVHGFYYRQLTGDSGSGTLLGDFHRRVLAPPSGYPFSPTLE